MVIKVEEHIEMEDDQLDGRFQNKVLKQHTSGEH